MFKRLFNRLNKLVLFSLTISLVLLNFSFNASAVTYSIPQTTGAKLSWDHNDPLPEGYRIYQRKDGQEYDYSNPVWTGTNNSAVVYNLVYDTTYYFVVRAYDGTLESVDSDEVTFMAPTPEPTTYSISTSVDGSGSISPSGVTTVTEGRDQTYRITPDSGYQITDVSVDGVSKGALSTYTFAEVDANHTIVAVFEAVILSSGDDGTVDSDSDIFNDGLIDFGDQEIVVSEEVIDDGDTGTSSSGKWSVSGGLNPYGNQSLYSQASGATYSYESAISGVYEVEMWWTTHSTRGTSIPVEIYDGSTLLETIYVNQQADGNQWNFMGVYEFTSQAKIVIISEGGNSTCADAVRFVKSSNVVSEEVIDDGDTGTSSSGKWSVSGGLNPYGNQSLYSQASGATYSYESAISGVYEVEMWWTTHSTRGTSIPVEIYDGSTLLETVYVNQQTDGNQWNLLGTHEFTSQAKVLIISEGGNSTCADAVRFVKSSNVVSEEVIDDGDTGTSSSGKWSVSGGLNPYGNQSLYSQASGATYSYESAISGVYEVEMWWTTHSTRGTSIPVEIYDGSMLLETVYVNQQADGNQWNLLGTYEFTSQAKVVIISEGGNSTCADAVRFVKSSNVVSEEVIDDGDTGTSSSGKWSVSGGLNPYGNQSLYSQASGATYSYESAISGVYEVEMWWTTHSTRGTSIPVEIYDGSTLLETVYVNQQADGNQWNLLGTYEFTSQAKVVIISEGGNSTCADAIRLTIK